MEHMDLVISKPTWCIYLLQRDCMVACLDDGHITSSAHMGPNSHDVNPGKERGHSLLCSRPSWTWAGDLNLGRTCGSV